MTLIGVAGLGDSILAFGTCLVILGTGSRAVKGRAISAPLRWFGHHSYEIYMTHEFVVVWVVMLYGFVQQGPIALWVVSIVGLCAPLGFLVARYFSEPLNRKLRPRRSSHATLEHSVTCVV